MDSVAKEKTRLRFDQVALLYRALLTLFLLPQPSLVAVSSLLRELSSTSTEGSGDEGAILFSVLRLLEVDLNPLRSASPLDIANGSAQVEGLSGVKFLVEVAEVGEDDEAEG